MNWDRHRLGGLPVEAGIAAAGGMTIVAVFAPRIAAAGWLVGFVFWSQIPLGSLTLMMIHRLTGGRWGLYPTFAPAARLVPLLFLLIVPVFIAIPLLGLWSHRAADIKPDVLSYYLNTPFLIARSLIAIAGWSVLAFLLPRTAGRPGELVAAVGLVFHCVVISVVAVDWVLALEPPITSSSFGASMAITQLIAALAWAVLWGWSESIFPPYFVVGAMYSGFAMVVCLTALVRWGFRLQPLITTEHFDVMAKIMLAAAIIMGLSYLTEWFNAWYGGEHAERSLLRFAFTGAYAPLFFAMLFCNVLAPQAFWFRAVRRSIAAVFALAVAINVGMWLERILIIWNTLSHGYTPSMWRLYLPTIWDWLTMFGSLGFFIFLFLIFVRLVPTVSMHEVRDLVAEEIEA